MVVERGRLAGMVGFRGDVGPNNGGFEKIQEPTAEIIKVIPQERISERIVEEILDIPVSEEVVDVLVNMQPQVCAVHVVPRGGASDCIHRQCGRHSSCATETFAHGANCTENR